MQLFNLIVILLFCLYIYSGEYATLVLGGKGGSTSSDGIWAINNLGEGFTFKLFIYSNKLNKYYYIIFDNYNIVVVFSYI